MQPSDNHSGDTSKIEQKSSDKSRIKIHNILPNIERTFLQIGSTIGKYCIIEEIDRGGMAVVYKALQLDLDREVALKVLPANITINRRFVERFLSEAHAVAKLQHPYIVNIHEVAVENNVYYLAMDFIPGMNLYYHLNFQKPKLVDVLEITVKLADALAYAHNQKIIHRDLKLNNIIMRDNVTPVLIDFGLAKALEGEDIALTKTGEIMGSPAYMAPERLSGANTDARSDICSLGIMLYEMLTFKNPYLDPRSMPQTTMNVMEANPILPRKLVPWLPVEIEAITLKAMHKDPDKRYQTMEEFRDDVKRYQRGDPVLANPPSIWTKGKHFLHAYWPLLAIGLVVALFSALFAFSFYLNKKKEQPFWRLSYTEDFSGAKHAGGWYARPVIVGKDTLQWSIRDKALRSPAAGYSYIRFERPFSREVKVEFDVRAVSENFGHAGFFLRGSCPDSGYCFHIHRGPEARCGITYPGNDFLFADYNPVTFVAGDRYHVCVESRNNGFVYKINDVIIARIRDYFGPAGQNHRSIGFFTDATACDFDNIRIYTYTLPLFRSPAVVADRIAQRGEFADALSEYEETLPEVSNAADANDITFKMCECRIGLQQYAEAEKLLEPLGKSRDDKDALTPRRLFWEGIVYGKQGDEEKADSSFVGLFECAPDDPLCQSAAAIMIKRAMDRLGRDDPIGAGRTMALLSRHYSGTPQACGKACLMLMEYYLSRGALEQAQSVGDSILVYYKSDMDVVISAQIGLSRAHLANGNKPQAIDMLNRCITGYMPSVGVWQAWMELAEIYEYDGNFPDAFTIYNKIFSDAPKFLVTSWMARIRMGEIAGRVNSEERPDKIFDNVLLSAHPFIMPRQIAQLYKGDLSKAEFRTWWTSTYPGSREYLDYWAKKAVLDGDAPHAAEYWEEFKKGLAPNTWTAIRINKTLSRLTRP
jgi:serine/threonine protein kinase/tetratricopeptide (TPR) repeat protein